MRAQSPLYYYLIYLSSVQIYKSNFYTRDNTLMVHIHTCTLTWTHGNLPVLLRAESCVAVYHLRTGKPSQ